MTKVLQIALLGPLAITIDNQPLPNLVSGKAQALLCYLAVNGRSHSRHALAGLLWGDLPDADARRNLRGVLMKLRQEVAPYLEISHQTVGLNPDSPLWIDVVQFRQDAADDSISKVEEALGLYRGDFLQAFVVRDAADFEAWMSQQRRQLQQEAVAAFDKVVVHYLETPNDGKGVTYAQKLLLLNNTRERSHRLLMQLYARRGERSRALEQFAQCRALLRAELGVEVSEETAVLADQIRTGYTEKRPSRPIVKPPNPLLKQSM